MGKKLLLPTDFSKNSWMAIQYAIKLYENHECDFYVLNTYTKELTGSKGVTLLDPEEAFNKLYENRSMRGLGDILIKLTFEKNNRKHRFHVLSRPGMFSDAVKNVVAELKIDMIIMGARGMGSEKEGKYGKNTLAVIKNVRKCPVLVVPKNITFARPKEIILATNFNANFKNSDIKYLTEFAKMTGASIQVLSLMDNGSWSLQQKSNKTRLRKYLKEFEHSFNVHHNMKMDDALSSFVEKQHSKMISYIDQKPSFWERLGFGKPISDKLGYFNHVPVLALYG